MQKMIILHEDGYHFDSLNAHLEDGWKVVYIQTTNSNNACGNVCYVVIEKED